MSDSQPFDGIAITRIFEAPRERVWAEWTEPERFADWFGGRETEIPLASVTMDVRPGGSWQATMLVDSDGREIHWRGEYLEVVPPERLVLTFSDQPDSDAFELVTVVLVDLGDDRTEMHFSQRGSLPPEQYERAGSGWGVFFDAMAERLARAIP
jgi:uncharacterized protein YndB with AHSA1/START domain